MSSIVNTLGVLAGGVWVLASIWFQLIREKPVHPKFVIGSFSIGASIIMGSAAVAVGSDRLVELLAITGNVLFLIVGLGVWYYVEVYAEDAPTAEDLDNCATRQ